MPNPTIAGKITLDESQAAAALKRIGANAAAVASKIDADFAKGFQGVNSAAFGVAKAAVAAFAVSAAAATAAGVAIGRGVANQLEAGRELQVLMRQTGASVAGLVVLQEKFRTAGLSADAVGPAIARLQKSIAGVEDEENKGGSKRLQQLGLNLAALQKMRPDQQLNAVGAAIAKIQDPAARAGAAMQIFGRAGAQLGAVFSGSFGAVPERVLHQAQLMAKNAALFERTAIELQRVGEITSSFYAGVADRVTSTLEPILAQLDRLDLVGIGQRFGNELARAGQIFAGIFTLPDTAFQTLQDSLKFAFASSGNVLLASMKTGVDFFNNGMLAAIEGLGDTLIAALLKGFAGPIAFFQAQLENTLDYFNSPTRQTKNAIANNQTAIAAAQKSVDYFQPGGQAEKNGEWNVAGQYKDAQANLAEATQTLAANRRVLAAQEKTEDRSLSASVEERKARILKDGVRFGLVDGGWTAEQYAERSKSRVGTAFEAAKAAFRNHPQEDVFGASEYRSRIQTGVTTLQRQGAANLGLIPSGPSSEVVAAAETSSLNHRPETRPTASRPETLPQAAGVGTVPSLSLMRPTSAPSTPVAPAPFSLGGWIGKLLGSALAPSVGTTAPGAFAQMTGSVQNWAKSPEGIARQAAVDTNTRNSFAAAHSVGAGSALDFQPSGGTYARDAFAGFKAADPNNSGQVAAAARERGNYYGTSGGVYANGTGLSTGGLGGGAYGATGNIWTQLSGRTNAGKSAEEKQLGVLTGIHGKMNDLVQIWKGGGSAGGGGGATVTG